jgi:hypothetical protein
MWSSTFYGTWWQWLPTDEGGYPDQKVAFDARNKLIYVNEGVTELDVKVDIYSAWKEWELGSPEYPHPTAYLQAFTVVGGDDITANQKLGATFFLENGWRIVPWASNDGYVLTINGNIYTREAGGNPIIPESNVTISLTRSNLIDVVVVEPVAATISPADIASIADAVWNEPIDDHTNAGTTGQKLKKSLNKTQYIARI